MSGTGETRKATAVAPANIAFIKYWGARDLEPPVPYNPSISMTLTRCHTRCTVEPLGAAGEDEVLLRSSDGDLRPPGTEFTRRVRACLDGIRRHAGVGGALRVATENSFPAAAGLASSASGFAALTTASTAALGLQYGAPELSSLARLGGSGSAARSLIGGFVEWPAAGNDETCPAERLAPEAHWDLRDVIALVDTGPKPVSSLDGHRRATTSPHFAARLERLPDRLRTVRDAIAARDLEAMGPAVEEDSIELHLVAMSSLPPIFYWRPATLSALAAVRELREDGVTAYATMDAGPNVHVICEPDADDAVAEKLDRIDGVHSVIRDRIGPGPRLVEEHLV